MVHGGAVASSDAVVEALVQVVCPTPPPARAAGLQLPDALAETARHYHLTPREHEVLTLMQQGLSTKAIAQSLAVSENTVETHRKHLYHKLGVHCLPEVLAKCASGPGGHPAQAAHGNPGGVGAKNPGSPG